MQPIVQSYADAPQSMSVQGGQGPVSLYVGELEPAVTEAMLFEIFNVIRPVARRARPRSAELFPNPRQAMPHHVVAAGSGLRKTGQGNILIKNLDQRIDNKTKNSMLCLLRSATSRPLSFRGTKKEGARASASPTSYEDHEDAQRAVEDLNNREVNGKPIFVGRAQKKSEHEDELRKQYEHAKYEKAGKYQGVNVYIKNLEDDVEDDKLHAELEPYGIITSCKVMRDETGSSKGFGFVCFASPDAATRAMSESNNKITCESSSLRVTSRPGAPVVTAGNVARLPMAGPGGPVTGAPVGCAAPPNSAPPNGMQLHGYKLNPSTRNVNPAGPAPAAVATPLESAINTAALANTPAAEQKQMFGEILYMKIFGNNRLEPELAGKITGTSVYDRQSDSN
ncbi:hypothetical protein CALCODRAFT_480694 [Calocera cornea HHB12733]|uniref:RRM domain-containing protein n=1 Tax=Calocera cornea HHB12733 TaxID=1353952 RepID=A0A165ICK6_9BASI|nr:hypothetical protein CALCODRAFT_480694 [Calocera cornea HHB12733]